MMASNNELNLSKCNSEAPESLRQLAGLELKRRQLLEDLVAIERDYRQLERNTFERDN